MNSSADIESRFRDLVDYLPVPVFELDGQGRFCYANRRMCEAAGCGPDRLLGMDISALFSPENMEKIKSILLAVMKDGKSIAHECEIMIGGGVSLPVILSINPVTVSGAVAGIRGVVTEISERKALETEIRKREERLRRISDMALEAIVFHEKGKIVDANKAFTEMFGFNLDDLIGADLISLAVPEYRDIILDHVRCRKTGPCEIRAIKSNGTVFDLEFISRVFIEAGKKYYAVVGQDISHRKKVEYLQDHDELTGLYNGRGFSRKLKDMIRTTDAKGVRFAVMCIKIGQEAYSVIKNLDPALEKILINAIPLEIAERLNSVLFADDVIARTGETEYMTLNLLPAENDSRKTMKLINKILDVFSMEFVNGIHLNVFAGVTFYPDDLKTDNPNPVINNCKYACGEAVSRDRNYMFYDEKSYRDTRESMEFAKDLIISVKLENFKNFMVHYQPKVNSAGIIVGMEALARWSHPRWNNPGCDFVDASRFIRVAEDIGLIAEIGNWVLEQACGHTVGLHARDARFRNLQVAVNVSPSQLNAEFLEYLDRVLKATGLPPEFLELEITERESVKEKNAAILSAIRNRNISIALDDFGIDYSALSRLPKLSIDTIKLDKSYIEKIAVDTDYEKLVNYTIKMAHGFSYTVVAEGVEFKEQAEKLFSEMECDKIQGFYYYRPLSMDEYISVLEFNLFGKGGGREGNK
ncbi:MAG: EAL domain-containing protein [Spirochaetes bacterium]|nr:EAL domain-containing protein [Spirochaetota bacterium]